MQQFSITAFSGEINQQETTLINARDLHAALDVKTKFATWVLRRIEDFGFVRDEDFIIIDPLPKNGKPLNTGLSGWLGGESKIDYHLTLDMAKELAMVERSEIGRQVRRYFIQIEKEVRDAIPAWALSQMEQTQAQLRAAQDLALSVRPKLPPVREFVRLLALGLSHREVAILLACGDTTVGRMAQRLRAAGLLLEVSAPALSGPRLEQLSLPHLAA